MKIQIKPADFFLLIQNIAITSSNTRCFVIVTVFIKYFRNHTLQGGTFIDMRECLLSSQYIENTFVLPGFSDLIYSYFSVIACNILHTLLAQL